MSSVVTTDQIGKRYDQEPNAYNKEVVNFAELRDRLLYMVQKADALCRYARWCGHIT